MRDSEDHLHQLLEQVTKEVAACVSKVSVKDLLHAGALVNDAPRIFVAGAGRSGLCMRSFAMRLMQIGKTVYVVGETTTPSIATGDLLILGSGSGRTASLLVMTERTRHEGAKVLLFTAEVSSPLAGLADHRVIVPAPAHRNSGAGVKPLSMQPMGTLFEQALLMISDALIMGLMHETGVNVTQMSQRHANLE